MNNRNLKNKKAFSLIELSIVILIVGIVVAGVTQSSRLISSFKLSTARNLTQSSPVASMKNLTLWWETTSSASFTDSQADNGLAVDTWYDINPTSTYKYNATQSNAGNKPTYTTNCVNSLPCLRFGGATDDDTMGYDGTFLVGSEYTIIVVEQRRDSKTINYFLAGGNNGTNANLHLGYRTDAALTIGQWGNDYNITVAAY